MVTTVINYSGFEIPHTTFKRKHFFFALKCYSVFSQHCSIILVPFFHFSIFSNYVCLHNITGERHLQGNQHFNIRIPLHTQSVSSEANCMLLLHQESQLMLSTTAPGRQSTNQSPVEKKPKSL